MSACESSGLGLTVKPPVGPATICSAVRGAASRRAVSYGTRRSMLMMIHQEKKWKKWRKRRKRRERRKLYM